MGAPSSSRANTSQPDGQTTTDDAGGLHKPPSSYNDANLSTYSTAAAAGSSADNSSVSSGAQAYLSLIQQYLSVFMIDNATFLAERCVAEYPDCSQAVYLQALCHYRAGNPKTARHILERHRHVVVPATSSSTTNYPHLQQIPEQQQQHQENSNLNIHDSNNNTNSMPLQDTQPRSAAAASTENSDSGAAATTAASMQYLSAQCSYELKDYSLSEDALLRETRAAFKLQPVREGLPAVGMDEWILQTSPCPVPNGAAGLALLGKIYRKSNRKERAIKYFKMSLQLDPFLWTSFEALAEMGEYVEPASVFGVESLPPQQPASVATQSGGVLGNNNTAAALAPQPGFLGGGSAAAAAATKTPLQPTKAATPAAAPLAVPPTGGSHYRPPNSGRGIVGGGSATSSNHPTAFETPGLTPIPMRNNASFLPAETPVQQQQHHQPPLLHPPSENHLSVVRRARQVASRQYYPPSPETPMTHVTRSMRYLHGLGGGGGGGLAAPNNSSYHQNDTSSSSMMVDNSMMSRGGVGGGTNVSTNTAVSATEARSLFLTSENKGSNQQAPPQQPRVIPPSTSSQHATNSSSGVTPTTQNTAGLGGVGGAQPQEQETEQDAVVKPETKKARGDTKSTTTNENKVQSILQILSVAGTGFQHLCRYKCRDALGTFQLLPPNQQTTAWVLHQQGRAFLELNDFSSAQRCLEYMHKLEPGRLKGLEILSTVYWQLKKEVELASLAQRVVDWDRNAPQAWCVVGNCFSLQKDHESALIFFQRSLQIDPDFTYTHTLSGYEYMANEDFDKAMACFRQALRTDDRHYNAWYGLGGIYHRQEKFDLAEYHFDRACSIHPSSSILRCNLGIAQYANGKAYQALETLAEASRLDPGNPQAWFQRATIYSALHRPEEALVELEKVLDAAPREATVHFAMGKVLKRLGRSDQAMKCFLAAMDLDPKDSQMIKSAMDKLDSPDDEETMATF